MIPNEQHCPEHIRESINAYVLQGRETGGFLRSVLENDLRGAITKADSANLNLLPHIVAWVINNVPTSVYGSKESVAKHLTTKAKERAALWQPVPPNQP